MDFYRMDANNLEKSDDQPMISTVGSHKLEKCGNVNFQTYKRNPKAMDAVDYNKKKKKTKKCKSKLKKLGNI